MGLHLPNVTYLLLPFLLQYFTLAKREEREGKKVRFDLGHPKHHNNNFYSESSRFNFTVFSAFGRGTHIS
jgi:hypothetical protein